MRYRTIDQRGRQRTRDERREREVLLQARNGDRAAFGELVRAHHERVFGMLFRLVGNPEDAEDLAQETFVKAHAALAEFRDEAAFGTWLFKIAVHLARDHARRAQVRGPLVALPPELLHPRARTPESAADARELRARLGDAIEALPHRLRAALVLRTLEGLEYAEVAAITGVTPATARMHVMKARRRLLRAMAPWIEEDER